VVFLRNLFAEADVTTSNSRRATLGPHGTDAARTKIPSPQNGTALAAYCAGFIELDPISRVSLVTQLS
jgi:hypothetical protein